MSRTTDTPLSAVRMTWDLSFLRSFEDLYSSLEILGLGELENLRILLTSALGFPSTLGLSFLHASSSVVMGGDKITTKS